MRNVMIDIETLGVKPGCAIVSIGAVEFDETGTGSQFYCIVNRTSCIHWGLRQEADTLRWWQTQGDSARTAFTDSISGGLMLTNALNDLSKFMATCCAEHPWGNGSDFDLSILNYAYHACGLETPWKFYNTRCYRTFKNLYPGVEPVREGTFHNALDDARSQAKHAVALLKTHALNLPVAVAHDMPSPDQSALELG